MRLYDQTKKTRGSFKPCKDCKGMNRRCDTCNGVGYTKIKHLKTPEQ